MSSPGAAFESPDFRFFVAARFTAILAIEAVNVAVGWQVYALTGRALDLGLVGLAQFLPIAGLTLVAGHVADRFDRRMILLLCFLTYAACAVMLSRSADVRFIYLVLVLIGAVRAFSGPASQALMPHLVPPEHLGNAVAWGSSAYKVANVAGPAVGGLAYALVGPRGVYLGAAALFVAACALMSAVRIRLGRMEHAALSWKTVLAGVEYVWRHKLVLGSISLDLFAVLLGGAEALLPIFARDLLHVGPWGLGLLRSASAIGAAITAITLAYRPIKERLGHVLFVSVAIFGLATIAFGVSRNFIVTMFALSIVGASDMVSVYIRMTLVPLVTPPEMRGRVSAVNLIFIGASNELGEFESGVTAQWLGAVRAAVAGGVGTLVVVGAWLGLFPALRNFDRFQDGTAESD